MQNLIILKKMFVSLIKILRLIKMNYNLPPLWLFLKYVTIVLHFVKIRFANEVEQTSFEIRLIACAIQCMLRILLYFSVIICCAFRIFAPESDTIAENFDGPIFFNISSIVWAKN